MEQKNNPFANIDRKDILSMAAAGIIRPRACVYMEYAYFAVKRIGFFNSLKLFLTFVGVHKGMEMRLDGMPYSISRKNVKDFFALIKMTSKYPSISADRRLRTITFEFQGKRVVIEGDGALGLINENFFIREYRDLNVGRKTVLDIGANIGDTAIYFSLSGANRVYAFEPFPFAYKLAKKNVEENHLSKVISVLNVGIGPDGMVRLGGNGADATSQVKNSSEESDTPVRMMSLGNALKKYGIERAVLKCDCEGAEYDIFLNSDNSTLKKFDEIILEYHYGYLNLKQRFEEAGFEVKLVGAPRYSFNRNWEHPRVIVGLMHAKK